MNDALLTLALVGFPLGILFGYSISRKIVPPSDKELANYMDRLVNQEELESQQRLNAYRMARNGQKSQRFDSGPPAQTFRMKVRPTTRRTNKD